MARILVINDESEIRTATRFILERDRHEMIEAACGAEGGALYHESPADLTITDLGMPGQSGVEPVAQLREKNSGL